MFFISTGLQLYHVIAVTLFDLFPNNCMGQMGHLYAMSFIHYAYIRTRIKRVSPTFQTIHPQKRFSRYIRIHCKSLALKPSFRGHKNLGFTESYT